MSKDEPLLSNCPLETAEPSRNYARAPGYKKKLQEKDKKRTREEKKNERRRNQYARVRRYKITSTLGLLVRGDPQNEGLRGLQPRALGSKLDYFHAGITSTRLHRLPLSSTASLRTNQTDVNRRHADSVGVGTLHANARLMGKHAAIAEGAITSPACADQEDQLERVEPKLMTLRKTSTRSTWEPLKLTR